MVLFLDANVFIRLLTRDDERKYSACVQLFERIELSEEQAATSEAIVAEVMYVLTSSSLYGLSHPQASALVRPLIELAAIQVDHKMALLEAFDLFESTSLGFEDCIAVSHARRLRAQAIVSYHRGFDRIPGVTRIEPMGASLKDSP